MLCWLQTTETSLRKTNKLLQNKTNKKILIYKNNTKK